MRGICIWLTGLSGAGKSTIAEQLAAQMMKMGTPVTLLDGDIIRTNLSKGLGFSREDRDTNIARIAFVAGEVTRHGGICIVAAISPYTEARLKAREVVDAAGGQFVEVFVATPIEECEIRDPKGLYAKVRSGEIENFTGISDPYEVPGDPDISLDTLNTTVAGCAEQIVGHLVCRQML